jgi:glycine/D-amino acid oxidase-like deaminating enzyme
VHPSLAGAEPTSAWLDTPARPEARPALSADSTADLVVVGGGYSGLWTAVLAKERDPGREVVLLEGQRIGWAASGRNGGFCSASLTHGRDNGEQRFPREIDTLERMGLQNLAEIESSVGRYGIDCAWELTGSLSVATEPHQVAWLRDADEGTYLDQDAIRAEVASPTYLAGLWTRDDNALVDPARLAWGLADAAERLGVRIHEHTEVTALE